MKYLREAFEELNKLYEAKSDQEAFIKKFGKDYFDLFNKFKGKLQSKNISSDMTWHVKHTSVEDMKEILDNFNNKVVTDDKGKSKLNRKKIFEDSKFVVWEILDWETAMNMADGASWCIAGRYQTKEPKPSQAEQYFNDYLKTTYENYYYVIAKDTNRKWCICKRKPSASAFKDYSIDIWSQEDRAIVSQSSGKGIEGLPSIPEIGYNIEDYTDFVKTDEASLSPEEELASDLLGDDVEYDESYGHWRAVNGGGAAAIYHIDELRDWWNDLLYDRFNDNSKEYRNYNCKGCLKDYWIEELISDNVSYILDEYGDVKLMNMCIKDNYDAFEDNSSSMCDRVYDLIRTVIIENCWDDEEVQRNIQDAIKDNEILDVRDIIENECRVFCEELSHKPNTTWLDVAEDVLGSDILDDVFDSYDSAEKYINFDKYWELNYESEIRDLYCWVDYAISPDGQLVAILE